MVINKKFLLAGSLFFLFAIPVTLAVVKVKEFGQTELEAKRKLADAAWAQVARGDNISAGREIESILDVAKMLSDSGDDAGAREYFRRATIIAPLRVDARLAYARLCAKAGENELAKSAYRIVLNQAEDDEMLQESAAFLSVEAYGKLPEFASAQERVGAKEIRLCLITVPGGQQWLAHDLGARLEQLLKIKVYVEQRDFVRLQPDRGGVPAFAQKLREEFPWNNFRFTVWASKQDFPGKDAATDEQIISLLRKYAQEFEGDSAVENFDKNLAMLSKHTSQWRADSLISNLSLSAMPRIGPRTLYVALIPQDIYADGANFMFGSAQVNGDYGVVSYHRFAAEFTGEAPKRERLVTRAYKQMLSSIGFMLGVPRCVDPACVRAYPASLEEHDSKGDKLCDECRAGFAKALGHELAR